MGQKGGASGERAGADWATVAACGPRPLVASHRRSPGDRKVEPFSACSSGSDVWKPIAAGAPRLSSSRLGCYTSVIACIKSGGRGPCSAGFSFDTDNDPMLFLFYF